MSSCFLFPVSDSVNCWGLETSPVFKAVKDVPVDVPVTEETEKEVVQAMGEAAELWSWLFATSP